VNATGNGVRTITKNKHLTHVRPTCPKQEKMSPLEREGHNVLLLYILTLHSQDAQDAHFFLFKALSTLLSTLARRGLKS
jgi:hypothetical protein